MTISSSGLISWLPLKGVLTSGAVTVKASNSSESDSQTFTITVDPANDQLQIISALENQTIDNGNAFSHQILVEDVDDQNNGQDISYQLLSSPEGMTVSSTGLIEWTSQVEQSSNFAIDISISDGGEDNTVAVNYTFTMDVLFYQEITGRTVNYFTGAGVANTQLYLFSSDSLVSTAQADDSGIFQLSILDTLLEDNLTLSAALENFSEHSLIIDSSALNQVQHVALLPSHVVSSFDASLEQNVIFEGESLIDFPASSLSREDGQAIEGNVTAQVTIIDPSFDINVMPGDMITRSGDEILPIESFGAINVVLKDDSGAAVNVAQGKTATIRIPLASNSSQAPINIPLYYFDENQGLWVEEGLAELVSLNGESFYQGEVSHFTTWNADRVYETSYVNGCVVDTDNMPVSNAKMVATGRDYNGSSSAFTDENGQFTIASRKNSTVLISGSQGSQSRTLSQYVGNDDITIENCLVLSPATSTVKLTWGQNPRDLDTHFYGPSNATGDTFHIYFGNKNFTSEESTIYLDVDDTSSYGPEILTVPAFPFAGRYQYIVKEYSGSGTILNSPTRVELNLESQIRIFSPAEGEATRYWHVFDFVVSETGEITIEEVNLWLGTLPTSLNSSSVQSTTDKLINSLSSKSIKDKYYK